MQINFIYPEKTGIKYRIDTYPDSQTHLILEEEMNRREKLEVYTRLSNLNDLWILMQLSDICKRQGILIDSIHVSYLFAARTDRLFSFNEALDLELVRRCLLDTNARIIEVLEPHSGRILSNYPAFYSPYTSIIPKAFDFDPPTSSQILFPDEGAKERYLSSYRRFEKITATKRRIAKNQLEITLDTSNISYDRPIYVVDDLCDGGGTFRAIYHALRSNSFEDFHLVVCHAIQKEALITLSAMYKTITISNSYKDWDKEELPSNIKIIKVYE